MGHELMRQAAKRSLAQVTQTQRDLVTLVTQLEYAQPDFHLVTDSLTTASVQGNEQGCSRLSNADRGLGKERSTTGPIHQQADRLSQYNER